MGKNQSKVQPKSREEHPVRAVLEFLGRTSDTRSEVKADNLAVVLNYMSIKKTEEWKKTLAKLSLSLGISQRILRENYLEGLEAWGIIELSQDSRGRIWHWVGVPETEK